MADNVQLSAPIGSGDTIAADDIGGIKHQYVKIEFGIADTATPVSTADPLPVTVLALPSGLATSANQTTEIAGLASIDTRLASIDGKITAVNTGAVVLAAGTAAIGKLAANSGIVIGSVEIAAAQTLATVTTVSTVTSLTQFNGNAISTNSGNVGAGVLRVVIATDQPQLSNKLLVTPDAGSTVQDIPATSGGLLLSSFLSTSAVQAAQIKGSAGQVYSIEFFNVGAAAVYVRLYNMTGTPGTIDTPVWRGIVPGNTAGAGFVKTWDKGLAFGTGIGWRVTAAIADNDATSLSASQVIGNIAYK